MIGGGVKVCPNSSFVPSTSLFSQCDSKCEYLFCLSSIIWAIEGWTRALHCAFDTSLITVWIAIRWGEDKKRWWSNIGKEIRGVSIMGMCRQEPESNHPLTLQYDFCDILSAFRRGSARFKRLFGLVWCSDPTSVTLKYEKVIVGCRWDGLCSLVKLCRRK